MAICIQLSGTICALLVEDLFGNLCKIILQDQKSFSYKETGLPGLNQYYARINVFAL